MQFEHYGVTMTCKGEPIEDDYAAAIIERGLALYGDGLVSIDAEAGDGYIELRHLVRQPEERFRRV